MANCNNLFKNFNNNLSITKTKKDRLITSKGELRKKIKDHFAAKHPEYVPKFRIQGSYILGTMIRTKDDTCDLDNGIYFFPKPKVSGTILQGWIWDAVEDATTQKPDHRKKCIRVIYKNDYHIDLPVYYKLCENNDAEKPHVAVKDGEWLLSDPKEFQAWFNKQKDKEGQLKKIVRYLKAWCDKMNKKMPNGLAMTVLAEGNIVYNERDDISLRDTLQAIEKTLKNEWKCIMPTTPQNDLFDTYKGDKNYFFGCLKDFISDADNAIDFEKNQLKASKLWQAHQGIYFPDGEDADVDDKLNQLINKAFLLKENKAQTSTAGVIVNTGTGVVNNPLHKFYSEDEE